MASVREFAVCCSNCIYSSALFAQFDCTKLVSPYAISVQTVRKIVRDICLPNAHNEQINKKKCTILICYFFVDVHLFSISAENPSECHLMHKPR